MTAEIVLGTAQFGVAYGITNTAGRLDQTVVEEVIGTAIRGGVATLDTAFAYGDAEERVGRAVARLGSRPRVVTKIALSDVDREGIGAVVSAASRRLHCERLDVLLHRVDDVWDPKFPFVLEGLRKAREEGLIGSFGASVYDESALDSVIAAMPDLGLIQLPGSIVDRRMLDLRTVSELAHDGVEIHVRSVFLQGLLLLPPAQLPSRFALLGPALSAIDAHAAERGTSRIAVLIGAVTSEPTVAGVIVGATSAEEIRVTLEAAATDVDSRLELERLPDDILDPRRWAR